jgi:hypothetical protein
MRRGETEADMQLVAKFVAAAAVLQQDPAALASEITRSRSLELILNQVLCCLVWDLLLVSAAMTPH